MATNPSYRPPPTTFRTSNYNPQVIPNSSIADGFFNAIRGGIDDMINFINNNKRAIGLREDKTNKSAIHILLEVDDNIIDSDMKFNMLQYLFANGTPIDTMDSTNITPLHIASKKQYTQIVTWLIEHNVRTNIQDSMGFTPLHYAINGYDIECPVDKKVEDLIPKQKIPYTNEIDELNKYIIDLIMNNRIQRFGGGFIPTKEALELITQKLSQLQEITKFDSNFNNYELLVKEELLNLSLTTKPNDISAKHN